MVTIRRTHLLVLTKDVLTMAYDHSKAFYRVFLLTLYAPKSPEKHNQINNKLSDVGSTRRSATADRKCTSNMALSHGGGAEGISI